MCTFYTCLDQIFTKQTGYPITITLEKDQEISMHTVSMATDILVSTSIAGIINAAYRCRTADAPDIHNERLATKKMTWNLMYEENGP